jgi:YidC/Oxa1 family membrane protein insertase
LGIFNAIVDGMTWLLNWLYQITGSFGLANYGIAIILLTVLIKVVLYPLTKKQMKSMLAMQQLQPKVKEIQDKWKDRDPEKMQQMIMDLYKENNVNPASGCLPLLVQMPILFALYRSLFDFPYINDFFYNIPGGTGYLRNNSPFLPHQGV